VGRRNDVSTDRERDARRRDARRDGGRLRIFSSSPLAVRALPGSRPARGADGSRDEYLLALGKLSPEFEDGQKALDERTAHRLKHHHAVRARGAPSDPEYFFLDRYARATDERGKLFSDKRVATTCVLMIWGAYIEAAASMGHTLWCLMRHPEAAEKVRAERRAAFVAEDLRAARVRLDDV
jgi:cytochrome P450